MLPILYILITLLTFGEQTTTQPPYVTNEETVLVAMEKGMICNTAEEVLLYIEKQITSPDCGFLSQAYLAKLTPLFPVKYNQEIYNIVQMDFFSYRFDTGEEIYLGKQYGYMKKGGLKTTVQDSAALLGEDI